MSPAEQAVYAVVYEGAHNTDHRMVGLKAGVACVRCEQTARAAVAAVRRPPAPCARCVGVGTVPVRIHGHGTYTVDCGACRGTGHTTEQEHATR